MQGKQLEYMLKEAYKMQDFKEIRRLKKAIAFQDPNFKYPPCAGNKSFNGF